MKGRLVDGRYWVRERLGEGGMGTVWLAWDVRLRRRVAVKIVTGTGADAGGGAARRLEREARVLAGLTSPHVVTVHDTGRTRVAGQSALYLVMERLEGQSLARVLRQRQPSLAETARWARQICAALRTAHRAGVVHRDLKPENVIVGEDGDVTVLDFGLAALLAGASGHTSLTATGALLGTPAYMSPEQAEGGTVDTRADLYALGCLLYALTTGRPPFTGERWHLLLQQHLHEQPVPPSRLRAGLPEEWEVLMLSLLAKRPQDRPATAGEVAARLGALPGAADAAGAGDAAGTPGGAEADAAGPAGPAGAAARPAGLVPTQQDGHRMADTQEAPPPERPAQAARETRQTRGPLPLRALAGRRARLLVGVSWEWPRDPDALRMSALGVTRWGRAAGRRHVVSELNPSSPRSALVLHGGDRQRLDVTLPALPRRVRRVRIVLSVPADGGGGQPGPGPRTLHEVRGLSLRLTTATGREDLVRHELPAGPEGRAAVLGELRRGRIGGGWSFVPGGRVYADGLGEVAQRHGTTLEPPRKRGEHGGRAARRAAARALSEARRLTGRTVVVSLTGSVTGTGLILLWQLGHGTSTRGGRFVGALADGVVDIAVVAVALRVVLASPGPAALGHAAGAAAGGGPGSVL